MEEEIVEISIPELTEMMSSYKRCGEFVNDNGLDIVKISYKDSVPYLTCKVFDSEKYMLLKIKHGI